MGTILPPPSSGGGAFDVVEEFTSVSEDTYALIPLILGISPAADKGIAAGRFKDCAGENIEGGEMVLTPADVDWQTFDPAQQPDGVFVRYFEEETPSRGQEWTSADGLFGAIDVPPGSWRVVMWGIVDGVECADAHPEHSPVCPISYGEVFVVPDSVNISNVELVTYPAACLVGG